MKRATFQFFGDLYIFLRPDQRNGAFEYPFNGNQSVKHLIEAAGIPHTEVHHILANGVWVDFNYLVQNGDQVQVYPIEIPQGYPPIWQTSVWQTSVWQTSHDPNQVRFILDNHLGKLATYLRMLGFDSLYQNNYQDYQLAETAATEGRILLTRDRRLLMRRIVQLGYWVRAKAPKQQLFEIVQRFNLAEAAHPFQRCIRCNYLLAPVEKSVILHRLEPLTQKYFNDFSICPGCDQIYWRGSHYERMLSLIQKTLLTHETNP